MQNPANVIDGIRGSLNTIWVTLQNITAEHDQFQNLLHDSIQRVDNLRNQFTDSGNQNLRLQRLLNEAPRKIMNYYTRHRIMGCNCSWILGRDKYFFNSMYE